MKRGPIIAGCLWACCYVVTVTSNGPKLKVGSNPRHKIQLHSYKTEQGHQVSNQKPTPSLEREPHSTFKRFRCIFAFTLQHYHHCIQWVSINIDSDALKLSTCCLPRSMALAVRTDLIPPASYAILLQFWVKKHINTLSSYILVYNNNEHCEASMHWTVRYLWNHSTQGYIAKKKFVTINSIVMLAACHGVVPHNLAIFLPPRSYSAKQLDHRLSLNTDSPYMRPLWK